MRHQRAEGEAPAPELFLELVPHGELTPKLWTLRVGDAVSLRPRPKGVFTGEEKFPVRLMVATVTGIAAFVSMLRPGLLVAAGRLADDVAVARALRRRRIVVPTALVATCVRAFGDTLRARVAGARGERARMNCAM